MSTKASIWTGRVLSGLAVAFLEGGSFIVLLGVAMPLKYMAGMPMAVRVVGLAHGILFLLYVWAVMGALANRGWTVKRTGYGLVAGLLPFGTFIFDAHLRKEGSI